jgi:hypothetical protein
MIAYEPTDIRDVVPAETYREHIELLAAELALAVNERDALRGALGKILAMWDRLHEENAEGEDASVGDSWAIIAMNMEPARALLAGQEGSGGV